MFIRNGQSIKKIVSNRKIKCIILHYIIMFRFLLLLFISFSNRSTNHAKIFQFTTCIIKSMELYVFYHNSFILEQHVVSINSVENNNIMRMSHDEPSCTEVMASQSSTSAIISLLLYYCQYRLYFNQQNSSLTRPLSMSIVFTPMNY